MQEPSARNPWKTLTSRRIYRNPWIEVLEHQVINPSGGQGIYGLVKFRNRAVGIVPLDEAGNTWLVGQYRYALQAYAWEIPMGGVPVEEDLLAGARRELREETGLVAGDWLELMRLHTSNSVTDEEGVVYVARALEMGMPEFEDTEAITIRRLPFEEALEWVMSGRITDAISVAALQRLALERQRFGL